MLESISSSISCCICDLSADFGAISCPRLKIWGFRFNSSRLGLKIVIFVWLWLSASILHYFTRSSIRLDRRGFWFKKKSCDCYVRARINSSWRGFRLRSLDFCVEVYAKICVFGGDFGFVFTWLRKIGVFVYFRFDYLHKRPHSLVFSIGALISVAFLCSRVKFWRIGGDFEFFFMWFWCMRQIARNCCFQLL